VKVAFVTDAPYSKDIRLQRTVEALQALECDIFALDQGMDVVTSKEALGDLGKHFPAPIPASGISRKMWSLKNRFLPIRAYQKRSEWTCNTLISIKPDVIHCINPFALEASANAVSELGAKFIYEAYEYWPEYLLQLGARVPHRLASKIAGIEEEFAKCADMFITVSAPLAGWYKSNLGIENVLVIYNVNSSGSAVSAVKNRFDDDSLSIVYAGILHPERNIDTAIEAVSKVKNVRLTILGEGVDRVRLQGLVRELGIEEKIRFRDMIPANELVEFLADYDLGLSLIPSTSRQMDGAVPNKIFDYTRAGLGVIAIDTVGLRSLKNLQRSFSLIATPCADLLALEFGRLNTERELVQKMKESSLENSHFYSRTSQMEKIRELYKTLSVSD